MRCHDGGRVLWDKLGAIDGPDPYAREVVCGAVKRGLGEFKRNDTLKGISLFG